VRTRIQRLDITMEDPTHLTPVERAAYEWYRRYQAVQENHCPRCDDQIEEAACICVEPLAALYAAERHLAETVRQELSDEA
jgi:hypothetical protein